jgi:hypothetical protein
MTYIGLHRSRRGLSPMRALLLGALVVGALDITDAFVFFGLRGVAPVRILQGIASGVLGRAALEGGVPAAVLGLCLHFFIAFAVVLVYQLASRRLGVLTRHPLIFGAIYGVAVYLVMNLAVLPLAGVGSGLPANPAVLANGVLIHVAGVGIPSALFARAAGLSPRRRYR